MSLVFLQLGFEAFDQREGIRRSAGEPREQAFVIKATDLTSTLLDHDIAECHLAIPAKSNLVASPNTDDGRTVVGIHDCLAIRGGTQQFKHFGAQAHGQQRLGVVSVIRA